MATVLSFRPAGEGAPIPVTDAAGRQVAEVSWRGTRSFEALDASRTPLCRSVAQGSMRRRWEVQDATGAAIAALSLRATGVVSVDLAGDDRWSVRYVRVSDRWELRGPRRRVALTGQDSRGADDGYDVTCHDDTLGLAQIVGIAETYRASAGVRRNLRRLGVVIDLAGGLSP